jgi:hypothetical protein
MDHRQVDTGSSQGPITATSIALKVKKQATRKAESKAKAQQLYRAEKAVFEKT